MISQKEGRSVAMEGVHYVRSRGKKKKTTKMKLTPLQLSQKLTLGKPLGFGY